MSTLIAAIQARLKPEAASIFDSEKIDHLIHTHQTQCPGSWQDYDVVEMSDYFADALHQAARDDETSSARIVMFYC